MLNVTATGNLVADPEQKEVRQGLWLTKMRVLVNKKKGDNTIVSALDCLIWGDKGNAACDFLKKGDQVTIAGSALLNLYEKKNGETGASIEVNVQEYSLPPKPKTQSDMPF